MLLELAELLKAWISGFHLFQYLTFRAIMGTLTALAVSLLAGPLIIRKLTEVKAGQVIRSDGYVTNLHSFWDGILGTSDHYLALDFFANEITHDPQLAAAALQRMRTRS